MKIKNLIVISDLHCGCRYGLYPPDGVILDEGATYEPTPAQRKLWGHWEQLWGEWAPGACHGEPFAIAINGDAIDGVHHGSVTQISNNLADQARICEAVVRPLVDACEGRLYWVRGTEAHVGPSGQEEERLARLLGAVPNEVGQYARFDLWIMIGECLVNLMHHIGTTSSSSHEASAVNAELTAAFTESARWGQRPPQVVVRSHRHRYSEVRVPMDGGFGISCVTPGWQLRTPFAYRVAGGRMSLPQFGGVLVRQGDRRWYTEPQVWTVARSETVCPQVKSPSRNCSEKSQRRKAKKG